LFEIGVKDGILIYLQRYMKESARGKFKRKRKYMELQGGD